MLKKRERERERETIPSEKTKKFIPVKEQWNSPLRFNRYQVQKEDNENTEWIKTSCQQKYSLL